MRSYEGYSIAMKMNARTISASLLSLLLAACAGDGATTPATDAAANDSALSDAAASDAYTLSLIHISEPTRPY